MNRRWRLRSVLKIRNNRQPNEVQLGLISTSTLDVVIEASLVSPVETKQARKWTLTGPVFLFTRERNGTISYRSNFRFTFPHRPISGPVLERTA